jgi:cation-transporting ATPase E
MSEDVQIARSALTTVTVLCGLLMIPFVEPPSQRWVAGDELSGDPRPTLLALGMLFLYAVVTALPALRGFFELSLLGAGDYALLVGVAVVWALVMRFVWRARVLERLLALDGA